MFVNMLVSLNANQRLIGLSVTTLSMFTYVDTEYKKTKTYTLCTSFNTL